MEFHSPFKLELTIHSAENLPIADITSSDPFVAISIGGRNEGRTKTMYRNRNPTWEETFNLKLLHRRSVVVLNIFDEDRGKDADLLGSVTIDLADFSLDQKVQKKYAVSPYGTFDTKLSKLEVSVYVKSNEAVIKVVPDIVVDSPAEVGDQSPLSPTSSLGESYIQEVVDEIVADCPQIAASESVVNALTRFVTKDKVGFFGEDLLRDLMWDAGSLTKSSAEAASLIKGSLRPVFNRTHLRLQNSSKILMSTKSCHWHPPIPKNTIQMNLCANDSKFVAIEFHNRLAMWVCARWLFMLYDFWKGTLKPTELPSWSANCTYVAQCSLNISDGRVITGRMVLALERPFEVRINEEYVSFKSIHNLILASDSLLPKTYILDIEILSYSATGEYSKEDQALMTPEAAPAAPAKKGIFQTVRMNIRSTVKGVASGAVQVVSGATDVAMNTTIGVASTTLGAARTLASGNPITIIHSAQDNIFAVGKDIRSILKDATSVLGEASTYVTAKFDNVAQKAHKTQHIYVDCNEDSFATRQVHNMRRSSFNKLQSVESGTPEEMVVGEYPDCDRSSSGVSLLLCHGNDTVQMVLGHKRLTAGMLQQKADVVCEVALNSQLGFGITVVNSRQLQLTSPAKATIGGGGMHMKMKFTDKHGNSRTLGRLQEVKTNSISPTPNPDWNCSAVFKAQDGFENAAFLRIEVCLDDFTTNFIVGTCFIPLELFRSKAKEYTFPMTRYKNTAVHFRDAYIQNGLGETTFRIHRIEEDGNSPATVALRTTLVESNIYNTRWFSECLPAGTVNSDSLKDVEEFSVMATQEGLEMISTGKHNVERGADQTDVFSTPQSSKKDQVSDRQTETSVDSLALTEDWGSNPSEDHSQEVVVEVFENQRRQPYYPFDWSNKAYTRPLFSDITYAVSYKFDTIEAANPPPGYKWSSNWCFDKAYTATDENGWSYGITFGKILSNYKQGKSHTKPPNMMARRRKWVRKAVCVDRASTIGRTAMTIFESANAAKGALPHTSSAASLHNTSFHGQAPGTPVTPKAPAALEPKLASWRNDYLVHSPNALVSVCQERSSSQGSVLVPWKQVKDAYLISPSVLSLVVQVNRYLYDKHAANIGFFRPADVEIFISNCPAAELKSMIEERKWFDSFKGKIRRLVASGTTSGTADDEEDDENTSDAGDFVPATEELSMGSELVAELDEHSIALEYRVRQIDKYIGQHNTSVDKAAQKEKSIILRRDCRLRAYMAALFGVGLQGDHHFVDTEIKAIMDRDFKVAQNIKHKTEVATANNRIEFYLDTAEKRIRDAVLCGWNYRTDRKLERCLELFANGYFIEIVGLLGTFFEDTGATTVQGLGSKVELINTYLKHNDRLATILDHALRPYALKAQPAATLSLFLDFDILVSWYTSVLLLEMRDRVNDVLALWKDPTKDVTGRAQQYKFPVPWVPQQVESDDTNFFSYIPEDLVEVLLTYLQYARVRKDTVAPSFQDSVGRLDTEVLMAYTSSFLYLSEQIAEQLNSKDWASAAAEEELSEYATWLSSVANDAHRVEVNKLHAPNRVADAAKEDEKFEQDSQEDLKKEGAIEKRTIKAFRNISITALDHLSCIVYIYVFHDRTDLLSDSLYKKWLDTLPSESGEGDGAIIPSIMEDVTFFLQEKQEFLSPFCYWNLVSLCADKMYVVYLSLFKIAHRFGGAFGATERTQIRADIESMRSGFQAALDDSARDTTEYRKFSFTIKNKFIPLDYCCDLLKDELGTAAFDETMKKLQDISEKNPTDSAALASMIETCLGLKGVSKYSTRRKVTPRKSETAGPRTPVTANPAQAPITPAPVTKAPAPAASAPTPPHPQAPAPARRRGSMFDYFTGHHADDHPAPPPAAPTAPTVTITAAATPIPADSTHSAGRDSPATPAAAEIDQEDEDDEAELRMAQQLREKAIIDCVALEIQTIRSHSIFTNAKHSSLSKSSPLERVFGTDFSSEFPLSVQVLHSARPPTVGTAGSAATSSSYFSAFTGMFGSRAKSRAVSVANHHHHHAIGGNSPMSPLSEEADLGQISVTGIKVEDLFYLDSLRKPHPYVKIQFGKFVYSTKVVLADTSADWSTDEPVIIPLHGIGTSDSARSSMADLHLTLYYKGFLTDQVIGTVAVPFAPYAPPLFNDKRFTIADFKSPQAILAAKKAETEGRNHPSIILSMAPVVSAPNTPAAPVTA